MSAESSGVPKKVLVTGGDGFLGWHLRCRLHSTTDHQVTAVGRADWHRLPELVADADVVYHLAGINRADPQALVDGNERLARDVAAALEARTPSSDGPVVVFANSVQVGNGSPYAEGKERAAGVLAAAAERAGGAFSDVLLPNLFGEHGRPAYNSFVATFVDAVVRGETPQVQDREIGLLHAQGAAAGLVLAAERPGAEVELATEETSVVEVLDTLLGFHALYPETGDVPDISSTLSRDLFNTYRARLFPERGPIALTPRADQRGRLVETVRAHGRGGQTFVSTTVPGVTRGEHYHLHKVERFVVLEGEAVIALRRMFTDDVVEFKVTGDQPVAIDMPTMWAHNITNVGDSTLTTLFWTDTLFDPEAPDTTPEPVGTKEQQR
ncbi:polysaccharide biosynthesis C-terminal domain-containing protein [Nocardioides campestrisoli]|uniref:polysaccharide biosynthesis C-terminal domain-containing protein n=1 Tax=Nocardioides campestrisoli TaxID=2736757 RepID=UPI0015E704F0|nr:NAD-dependent epimerase/dehydratase family protein [Nocardioides campestrisoli]